MAPTICYNDINNLHGVVKFFDTNILFKYLTFFHYPKQKRKESISEIGRD